MPPKKTDLTRRKFLELSATGAAASFMALPIVSLAGCSELQAKTVHGVCYHDCPDRCSWSITTEGDKVTRFEASESNPYTAGKLCDKMQNFPDDVTFHPDRILTPLKRVGKKGEGRFEPVEWDVAMADISRRLKSIIKDKGGEAILPYSFGGNQGRVQSAAGNRFFARVGASQLERTICGNTVVAGILAVNGQTTGVMPEDIVHSRYIILWGTNPALSNQHLWRLIQKAQSQGARVVVVDPFRSKTALQADEHIQLMPGTDTVLALSMIQVILSESLEDRDYIDRYTSGIEELSGHVQQFTPEVAADITGLSEQTIIDLARNYASSSPSLIRVLIGLEHQTNGGSASRAIAMLPAITGAWRDFGGGLLNMTYELFGQALNWDKLTLPPELAGQTTRSINMVKLGKALTEEEMEPPVDALIVYNSNPAVTTPNQNLVLKGLEREDLLTIVLEHFVTDTARYADYIFPATTVLENWDILTSWGTPYLNINEPALEPRGKSKTNTDFFRLLSKEMGYKEDYLFNSDLDIVKHCFKSDHPYLKGITFDSLVNSGWAKLNIPDRWTPHVEGEFATKSGKVLFYNPDIDSPLPQYERHIYSAQDLKLHPLRLLTVKSPGNFLNSSHANMEYLRKKEGAQLIDMHKEDAEARGLTDGGKVTVYNSRGEVKLDLRISERVGKGVVCMPQGYWLSLVTGGSTANALTDDLLTDMGGGAAIQEARVEVISA